MIYLLIKTNCNSSAQGQIINISLHKTKKEAEQAGKKSEFGEINLNGIIGWWNDKSEMFCYVEEKEYV